MLLIKDLLKERKLTQKDLAQMIGCSYQNVKIMLNGNMTLSSLEKVANALGVELWELFIRKDDPRLRSGKK